MAVLETVARDHTIRESPGDSSGAPLLSGHANGAPIDLSSGDVPLHPYYSREIWIGGGGTLCCALVDNPSLVLTFNGIASGTKLNLQINKIVKAGTTCTSMIALW